MTVREESLLVKGELIGKGVRIKDCKDPSWVGKMGKIVDETKNTFKIEIDGEEKIIAKDIAVFEFKLGNKTYEVEGTRLKFRPEERIKKAR
ncbi:MAG TPA: ribonuclease P protein subunit [Thermoplasmatales archaeon]|nr:ribonuclease P protein subunit [Thermoplasmatales archaeon]